MTIISLLVIIGFTLACLAYQLSAATWQIGALVWFIGTSLLGFLGWVTLSASAVVLGVMIVFFNVPAVRSFISKRIYANAVKVIPKLSSTEEEALNAGDTWLEKSLFMGAPDWQALYDVPKHALTHEEQSFLDNEVQTLCSMIDDWQVSQDKDLPENIWAFLKEHRFLGLVIAKEYGGLGFSAKAHSEIVMKIATHSTVAAVTVMVPNSLGPGELISHYGTQQQKEAYLPTLANGEHIPCFALTEPTAGSDATSIQSEAIVIKKNIDGKETLGLSLTFNKRWITLAPVATLIGLAVDLKDPEALLSQGSEGITCVLIPRNTEGLQIGNRHIPCNQYFMNGTIRGKEVFIPIDAIIGGEENAGKGWRMLVECLSIGRSISLPALGTAGSNIAYLATSAYAKVRRQFNTEIGKFEGIEEKLAEIAGLTYLVNATRQLTVAAVDANKKPSTASAIAKYFNTENGRKNVINGVDVHGGKAVVNGPRNYMMNLYQSMPICITVEGANIMTRNLLLFGQGAMACHPFLREEFYALSKEQPEKFGELIWQHAHYFLSNLAKTILASLTGGYLIQSPRAHFKRAHQRLSRLSYAFAWVSDLALMLLGGELKRKERLSARLGDALSHLYMAAATLKAVQGSENEAEVAHANWALTHCFYEIQEAIIAFANNFPVRPVGWLIKLCAFPFGKRFSKNSDSDEQVLAGMTMKNQAVRESIRKSIFLSGNTENGLDKVEHAFQIVSDTEHLFKKIKGLGRVHLNELDDFLTKQVSDKVITTAEKELLLKAEYARWDAIQVDEFAFDAFIESRDKLPPVEMEA